MEVFFSRGAKGRNFPVGRTRARNPTANPAVGRGLLRRGGLGPTPTVGAVLMRTTCVGGARRICDTRTIGFFSIRIANARPEWISFGAVTA